MMDTGEPLGSLSLSGREWVDAEFGWDRRSEIKPCRSAPIDHGAHANRAEALGFHFVVHNCEAD